jgi:hypothetical protein
VEVQGITATTLLTLALGIGATMAIFSTVYSASISDLNERGSLAGCLPASQL